MRDDAGCSFDGICCALVWLSSTPTFFAIPCRTLSVLVQVLCVETTGSSVPEAIRIVFCYDQRLLACV
jgi:hypothetical protein